jgi:hypothetical protein
VSRDLGGEEFSDNEAALFFECEEREAEIAKARRCSDPDLRDAALACLYEEIIQSVAKFTDEVLDEADWVELELTDEDRETMLEGIKLAVDRPDWYAPGDRVVLPEEGSDE